MKIPNNEQSIVAENKITNYLLSQIHEIGKHKAFFFNRFGYNLNNINEFKNALLQHAIEREIAQTQNSDFGCKYVLKCNLQTPDNRNPCIVSVWIIEKGNQNPTLVTAYPDK
ncbi:MAG: DUF6883 domain-containing protein [Flavobacterium sp.]|uniref:DUF6883 domain-containing protein n=1 Tax=Flavobacterium sp. TaxID=239 RepID=UPI003265AD29